MDRKAEEVMEKEGRTPWGRAGEAVGDGGQLVPDGVRLQLLLLRRRRRHLRACVARWLSASCCFFSLPLRFSWEGNGRELAKVLPTLVVAMRYLNFEATGRGGAGAGTRQRTNGRGRALMIPRRGDSRTPRLPLPRTSNGSAAAEAEQ